MFIPDEPSKVEISNRPMGREVVEDSLMVWVGGRQMELAMVAIVIMTRAVAVGWR